MQVSRSDPDQQPDAQIAMTGQELRHQTRMLAFSRQHWVSLVSWTCCEGLLPVCRLSGGGL